MLNIILVKQQQRPCEPAGKQMLVFNLKPQRSLAKLLACLHLSVFYYTDFALFAVFVVTGCSVTFSVCVT